MTTFGRFYLVINFLIIYFTLLLPWALSQASDTIVILGFISLAIIIFELISYFIKVIKRKRDL